MSLKSTGVSSQATSRTTWGNLGNEGISLSCWVKGFASNVTSNPVFSIVGSGSVIMSFFVWGPQAVMYAQAQDASAVTQKWSCSMSSFVPASGWTHIAMVQPASGGSSSLIPYVNGVTGAGSWINQQTGNPSMNNAPLASVQVGDIQGTGAGLVAECAWWKTALTQSQISQLCAGASPRDISPSRLEDYYPLRGSLRNEGKLRVGLTPTTGTTGTVSFAEHPNIRRPMSAYPMFTLMRPGAASVVSRRPFITIAA